MFETETKRFVLVVSKLVQLNIRHPLRQSLPRITNLQVCHRPALAQSHGRCLKYMSSYCFSRQVLIEFVCERGIMKKHFEF